jgi:hypothetical protein
MSYEPYDYLSTITSDYDYTLTIKAQGTVTEEGYKSQVIHLADDNSEEVVTLSPNSIFYVSWNWGLLSESESGTIFDLYHVLLKLMAWLEVLNGLDMTVTHTW